MLSNLRDWHDHDGTDSGNTIVSRCLRSNCDLCCMLTMRPLPCYLQRASHPGLILYADQRRRCCTGMGKHSRELGMLMHDNSKTKTAPTLYELRTQWRACDDDVCDALTIMWVINVMRFIEWMKRPADISESSIAYVRSSKHNKYILRTFEVFYTQW